MMQETHFSLGTLNRLLATNEAKDLSDEELERCANESMAYFSVLKALKKYRDLNLLKLIKNKKYEQFEDEQLSYTKTNRNGNCLTCNNTGCCDDFCNG